MILMMRLGGEEGVACAFAHAKLAAAAALPLPPPLSPAPKGEALRDDTEGLVAPAFAAEPNLKPDSSAIARWRIAC